MGQDATTVAVSEPAVSFQFDSSQSLYEQLTKAQQANSSSFAANASTTYGQSASPVVRTVDPMPPPQMAPQMAPPAIPYAPDESGSSAMYNQVPMPNPVTQGLVKREQDYGSIQYDRNGMPIRVHQRHSSMPTFVEYSPAPSFVSSQYEDYSNRGLSYEPVTPPQQSVPLGAEPAYIANEDTGLYTAIPDMPSTGAFNPMMQLPPSNLASAHFPAPRNFTSNGYSAMEGSPTYKQRRRRSSNTPGAPNGHVSTQSATTPSIPYAAHRPSDLRRSVSSSVAPAASGDDSNHGSSQRLNGYPQSALPQKDALHEMSRTGTPLSSVGEHPDQTLANSHEDTDPHGDGFESHVSNSARMGRAGYGPVRRARSATMMELGPYPQKSHACPIPTCGRLFKRLEHLKR